MAYFDVIAICSTKKLFGMLQIISCINKYRHLYVIFFIINKDLYKVPNNIK